MENISNLEVYNTNMAKSMEDKLFFMNIIGKDIDALVDFGCADGVLLKAVEQINPNIPLFGIDMNEKMIEKAQEKCPNGKFRISKLPVINTFPCKGSLNLSSVLHEVYSYSSSIEERTFWENVTYSEYEYIIIRDMIYNDNATKLANKNDIDKVYSRYKDYVFDNADEIGNVYEFEDIWGSIKYKKNLVHYLLKYRYLVNWKREVKENYLGYSTEDIIKNIGNNYQLIYRKDHILPYLYNKVKEDFGIELDTPTHTNLIFKLKKG